MSFEEIILFVWSCIYPIKFSFLAGNYVAEPDNDRANTIVMFQFRFFTPNKYINKVAKCYVVWNITKLNYVLSWQNFILLLHFSLAIFESFPGNFCNRHVNFTEEISTDSLRHFPLQRGRNFIIHSFMTSGDPSMLNVRDGDYYILAYFLKSRTV